MKDAKDFSDQLYQKHGSFTSLFITVACAPELSRLERMPGIAFLVDVSHPSLRVPGLIRLFSGKCIKFTKMCSMPLC